MHDANIVMIFMLVGILLGGIIKIIPKIAMIIFFYLVVAFRFYLEMVYPNCQFLMLDNCPIAAWAVEKNLLLDFLMISVIPIPIALIIYGFLGNAARMMQQVSESDGPKTRSEYLTKVRKSIEEGDTNADRWAFRDPKTQAVTNVVKFEYSDKIVFRTSDTGETIGKILKPK